MNERRLVTMVHLFVCVCANSIIFTTKKLYTLCVCIRERERERKTKLKKNNKDHQHHRSDDY